MNRGPHLIGRRLGAIKLLIYVSPFIVEMITGQHQAGAGLSSPRRDHVKCDAAPTPILPNTSDKLPAPSRVQS
eukprot:1594568-Pyramimonas_sp.AAC.1